MKKSEWQISSKAYGDYAVSLCTTYFLSQGFRVLKPHCDRGHYDLVVEKDGKFQRVQCKRTRAISKPQGYFRVSLQVKGFRRKENGRIVRGAIHTYTKQDFDLLWVVTPPSCYLIPLSDILGDRETKTDLKLTPRWDKYKVDIPMPPDIHS